MINLGLKNFLMIGVMAILFIVVAKVIFTKYDIKGVSKLVQSA